MTHQLRPNPLRALYWRSSAPLRFPILAAAVMAVGMAVHAFGQAAQVSAGAAAATVVPNLIRFSGTLKDGRGYPITTPIDVTFSLYASQAGEEKSALWQEKQHVLPNETGAYTVYLGAATELPPEVFTSVTAQYVGVKLDGEPEQLRVPLVSVPYALKSGDAQTLGGLPASAFALAGSKNTLVPIAAPAISPDASLTVTTAGGTSGSVPMFTGASTIGNSIINATGNSIGIGDVPNPSVKLDVNGAIIMRGEMIVSRTGNASTTQAFPSYGFQFFSNVWNSSTHAWDNPYFQLQSEPTGNNTSTPSATFNLLFANNGGAIGETGFYINPNGQVHFASGQTFPGTGTGTITGVTAGTDLTGGGTSGSVTLNLNTGATDARYARLAANNSFTGSLSVSDSGTISSIYGVCTSCAAAVHGYVDSTSTAGVLGEGNIGVYGTSDENKSPAITAGVYGQAGTISNTGLSLLGDPAGLFGDGGSYSSPRGSQYGLVAAADDAAAGHFQNNSSGNSTVEIQNVGPGPFLTAVGPDGTCLIGGNGDVICTGAFLGSNDTADKRTIQTYGVQSAENWYEDAGFGQLQNGVAHIRLDPTFGETVNTAVDYHVFLTPNGESNGLYVTNKTESGFEVHESGHGSSNIAFDYRIMAKRKGFEHVRLEDVTEEKAKLEGPRPKPGAVPTRAATSAPTQAIP